MNRTVVRYSNQIGGCISNRFPNAVLLSNSSLRALSSSVSLVATVLLWAAASWPCSALSSTALGPQRNTHHNQTKSINWNLASGKRHMFRRYTTVLVKYV